MSLRLRLFLGFALALGLVLPAGLALEYRMTAGLSREWMQQQSTFVAELLREKLIDPLHEVALASHERGQGGAWQQATLNLEADQAITWVETSGRRVPVPLKVLLESLHEVPLQSSGYTFLLDRHGTLLACLKDGQVAAVTISAQQTQRAFDLKGTDRALTKIDDPLYHQPADLVLLSLPEFGLAVGVIFPEQEITDRLAPLARSISQAAVLLLLVVWLLSYSLAGLITKPLEELTQAVARTVQGELEVPLMPSDIHEVNELSAAFAKMQADLAAYLDLITTTSAQTARVARELELAKAIQGNADLSLTLAGWKASGKSEAAREVGGDFMDAFATDNGGLALLVGDVSGKGIPAALHTLLARAGLKLGLTQSGSPAQALKQANSLLAQDNPDSVFVSAVVAIFYPETQQMVWARAGHPTPLTKDGPISGPNGPPLGLLADVDYQETTVAIAHQAYLFYTDGFPEAENETGQFMTIEPLRQALSARDHDIWTLLLDHRQGAEPSDDATAIMLAPMAIGPGSEPEPDER
jgi:hypothetical protein